MIKAISFDFYGTLATWDPSGEKLQLEAAKAEGLKVDAEKIGEACASADKYLAFENSISPFSMRSYSERNQILIEYERVLLAILCPDATKKNAQRVWERIESTPKQLKSYESARDILENLISRQLKIGIISNIAEGLTKVVNNSGLEGLSSFMVSSGEVGHSKPHPAIFEAALKACGVHPHEMIHVGDSLEGDVHGALGSGINAILIDRNKSKNISKSEKFYVIPCIEKLLPLLKANFNIL
ncbi:MAG: hypothetical protein CL889_00505 [Dehalococcoidia bacterium]|nr:hypothetical protein [Dehalococcoidia bacterium]|tara:strand:- start:8808 stop:9530 length:723 start_codon:yes stop_codon:yes gene_type:complete